MCIRGSVEEELKKKVALTRIQWNGKAYHDAFLKLAEIRISSLLVLLLEFRSSAGTDLR